ncbi:bifunctional endoribonuclease/protein kinase ire1 [Tulasnella sp. 403]|nr:bifunctional endoribonuclease/protein kinase ire1 [Tulasnella sp. 403]
MASSVVFFLALLPILALSLSAQPLFQSQRAVTALQKYDSHAIPRREPLRADELQVLDTVLLASVDGRFHALNRTTNRLLWSMDKPITKPAVAIDNLHELVRTQHGTLNHGQGDPFDADEDDLVTETYIIEPQSGAIYVKPVDAKRGHPLQRLPFSMAQLVDHSPFRFDDHRTFVGKKRTSLITLDLASGEVLEILDPEQCSPSDEPSAFWKKPLSRDEELLDELDTPDLPQTLVHIGRTDYHVSVFAHGRVIQNLTYTSYGPNNLDKEMQALWRRTPDNRYHQPTPDGTLLMFKTDEHEPFRSFMKFQRTIVAVFDAVTLADRSSPVLLLQPTPSLNDLYPTRLKELRELSKNADLTYVGRIGNSLYALSHHTFPHVLFSQFPSVQTIDSEDPSSLPLSEEEALLTFQSECNSLDCLVGVHWTENASVSSLSKLIAGSAPKSGLPRKEHTVSVPAIGEDGEDLIDSKASSSSPPVVMGTPRPSSVPELPRIDPPTQVGFLTLGQDMKNPLLTGLIGLVVVVWIFVKQIGTRWKARVALQHVADRHQAPDLTAGRLSFGVNVTPLGKFSLQDAKPLPPVPVEVPAPSKAVSTSGEPDGGNEVESDKDGGNATETPQDNKKRGQRRKRGRGKKVTIADPSKEEANGAPVGESSVVQTSTVSGNAPVPSSLVVSETVLGYGSHGTMVFQGSFQGRAVAVKRLLQDFVTLASREVNILQESDDHPNVIRYYYKENKDNFLYIALELCPASLADIIERPNAFPEIYATFDPKRALTQITNGLKHLHSLKIVHRDIKPQNILISKPGAAGPGRPANQYRMLISDFGLCRKLESDQTSFLPTMHSGGGAQAAGTVGWRAPEILRGEVKLDEPTLDVSSGGSPNSSIGGTGSSAGKVGNPNITRLTKSVDVFALGCLYYYVLTIGEHPYGERYEREMNILKNVKQLEKLEAFGEEGLEAQDLVEAMLDPEPKSRPDTKGCLIHPFFWSAERRLAFLLDASDRLEIMQREPREPPLERLETDAQAIVSTNWHKKLDKSFLEHAAKRRKYDNKSVQELLRVLRNQKNHYQDIPPEVKQVLGSLPDGFLSYFTRRFPRLFLHVYGVIADDASLRSEGMFKPYFELGE